MISPCLKMLVKNINNNIINKIFVKKLLDKHKIKEYNVQNSSGGKAMLNHIDRFNNVVVMMSVVPAYYWQNNGLTLLYPYSNK